VKTDDDFEQSVHLITENDKPSSEKKNKLKNHQGLSIHPSIF